MTPLRGARVCRAPWGRAGWRPGSAGVPAQGYAWAARAHGPDSRKHVQDAFRRWPSLLLGRCATSSWSTWHLGVGPTFRGPPPSRRPPRASSRLRPAAGLGVGPPRSRDVGSAVAVKEPAGA